MNKKTKTNKKNQKGITLLESVFSLFIVTMTVFASFSLLQQTVAGTALNKSKLVAHYLAQAEIENIKNTRDYNILNNLSWKQGIVSKNPQLVPDLNKFKREIIVRELTNGSEDFLEIEVIISWDERRRTHQVEAINHLYNWYN